jgi:molecular chaperone DnaK (HSP70)
MSTYGIDFGTTNCVVAQLVEGQPQVLRLDRNIDADWQQFDAFTQLVPSEFGIVGSGDGQREVFGWAAKLRAHESIAAVKRLLNSDEPIALGGSLHSTEKVAALLFGMLRAGVSSAGGLLDAAVITIPANSSGKARHRTRVAAQMAKIAPKALINEPTAAAIAYRYAHEGPESMLVFDFGGGTLDVTVLEYLEGMFVERTSRGVAGLGGLDFDQRLSELALRRLGVDQDTWDAAERRIFRLTIERAKIRLSSDAVALITTPDLSHAVEVTREDFVAACADLFDRAVEPVRRCLSDLAMRGDDLDAVLLVGGTSAMPEVRSRVRELLQQEEVSTALCPPMTAVAEGAAITAGIRAGTLPALGFRVVTEHALGTKVTRAGQRQASFSEIVPRGVPLPCRYERRYTPDNPKTKQVVVEVWEGDPDQPLTADTNVKLKDIALPVLQTDGVANKFLLEYVYDVDAILHVTAKDLNIGAMLLEDDVAFLDDPQIIARRRAEIAEVAATFVAPRRPQPGPPPTTPPTPAPVLRIGSGVVSTAPLALVVDGSNIACEGLDVQGSGDAPSYARLQDGMAALARAFPQARIVVIVDANFRHKVALSERAQVEQARRERRLWEPAAGWDGKADAAVAQLAQLKGGAVVTNDNYHPFQAEFPWLREPGRVYGMRWIDGDWLIRERTPTKPPASTRPRRLPAAPIVPAQAAEPLHDTRPAGWSTSHWWSGE